VTTATYTFRSEWTVPAQTEDLYDVLEDVAGYPRWWPQVRAVARLDDEMVLVACRALLPYTLHVELSPQVRDRSAGVLEASLGGDLVGHSRWTLSPSGAGTRMVYDQQVHTPSALMRGLTRLARPALEANHGWMMRGALRGLAGRTARW
jgi:hypothetical protein